MGSTEVLTDETTKVECLIHVRFAPNGTVTEIGEKPQSVPAQEWFKFLSHNTLNKYQALAGGRGLFRLLRPDLDSLKKACEAEQAA